MTSGTPDAASLDLQFGRITRALAQPGAYPSAAKRKRLYDASLQACDGLDGVVDGPVSNIKACNAIFNPTTATVSGVALRCPGGTEGGDTCLSDAQIAAFNVINTPITFNYALASGETQYPGFNTWGTDFGIPNASASQATVSFLALSTAQPTSPMPTGAPYESIFWDQWVRFFVTRDPNFNSLTLDPQNPGIYQARISTLTGLQDVNRTDLSAFLAKGGKILMAHGMSDALVSTRATEQFSFPLWGKVGSRKGVSPSTLGAFPTRRACKPEAGGSPKASDSRCSTSVARFARPLPDPPPEGRERCGARQRGGNVSRRPLPHRALRFELHVFQPAMMRILTVSTGTAAPLFVPAPGGQRQQVMSGIRKTPVSTLADPRRIALGDLGFVGDEQVDLTVHGGRDKAVYIYPVEHYPTWATIREQATKIDEPLPHGWMGENLTIEGLQENRVWVGDVLVIEPADGTDAADAPQVRLRVDAPREPCFKFNARMGFNHASKMMVQSGFTGFYLEVLQTGTVAAGDTFRVVPGAREVTIEELHRLMTRGKQKSLF